MNMETKERLQLKMYVSTGIRDMFYRDFTAKTLNHSISYSIGINLDWGQPENVWIFSFHQHKRICNPVGWSKLIHMKGNGSNFENTE